MYLLHTLKRENVTPKDELNATTMAMTATAPSAAPAPKFIAVAVNTVRDSTLIAAPKEKSATQAAQITKLLSSLTAGGGGNG